MTHSQRFKRSATDIRPELGHLPHEVRLNASYAGANSWQPQQIQTSLGVRIHVSISLPGMGLERRDESSLVRYCCRFAVHLWASARSSRPKRNKRKPQTYATNKRERELTADESAQGEKLFRTHIVVAATTRRRIFLHAKLKAVVRQMRVRATLTDEDERLILKYLAP